MQNGAGGATMGRRVSLPIAVALGILHCGDEGTRSSPSDASADASIADVSTSDRCSADALAEPRVATTYYVAAEQPGADNDACDGKAAASEGAGHCPFKDLHAIDARGLFRAAKGVRVELRSGNYVVDTWEGFTIDGAGAAESE